MTQAKLQRLTFSMSSLIGRYRTSAPRVVHIEREIGAACGRSGQASLPLIEIGCKVRDGLGERQAVERSAPAGAVIQIEPRKGIIGPRVLIQ
jgi:hypothetical protein